MLSDVRMEKKLGPEDIGSLFHCILFAYQKSLRDILGTGSAVFVHPVLDIIKEINEKRGINLIQGENIDEVFDNLSKLLQGTGFVAELRFEKLAPKKMFFTSMDVLGLLTYTQN